VLNFLIREYFIYV